MLRAALLRPAVAGRFAAGGLAASARRAAPPRRAAPLSIDDFLPAASAGGETLRQRWAATASAASATPPRLSNRVLVRGAAAGLSLGFALGFLTSQADCAPSWEKFLLRGECRGPHIATLRRHAHTSPSSDTDAPEAVRRTCGFPGCGTTATLAAPSTPGKRWCDAHAPTDKVPASAAQRCSSSGCGTGAHFIFDEAPGERWCSDHAPAAARELGLKLECINAACRRLYPGYGRSGLCGACRPVAERKRRSVRVEEIMLQALRAAFPADQGWHLTHNNTGIGGQNDNLCAGSPDFLADKKYRVDFVIWHADNPNQVTLFECDEHQHPLSAYACDDARTFELFQRAPSEAPMLMLRVNPDGWVLEKADGSRERMPSTRVGDQVDHALLAERLAPAVAVVRAFSKSAPLAKARIVKVAFDGDAAVQVYEYEGALATPDGVVLGLELTRLAEEEEELA